MELLLPHDGYKGREEYKDSVVFDCRVFCHGFLFKVLDHRFEGQGAF